jgi:hypothetical protein
LGAIIGVVTSANINVKKSPTKSNIIKSMIIGVFIICEDDEEESSSPTTAQTIQVVAVIVIQRHNH